jgi:SAM-dependent methyltransferase
MDAESHRCVVCTSSRFERSRSGSEGHQVLICDHCGLGITSPVPSRHELDDLYARHAYRAHDRRFVRAVEWLVRAARRARFARVKRRAAGRRLLDIGCARGLMLAAARDEGWEVVGLELNAETAHHAHKVLGLDVRAVDIRDAGFSDASFDVVTLWHVLEHLPQPVEVLREAHRVLEPGGLLVVALPNLASLQARLGGRHWFHLDLPFHLFHFPLHSLTMALESTGFSVAEVRHLSLEYGPFGVLQSLLNLLTPGRNHLYDAFKPRALRRDPPGWQRTAVLAWTLLLLPVLAPLSLAVALIEAGLGRGGCIEVYARRVTP